MINKILKIGQNIINKRNISILNGFQQEIKESDDIES